MTHPITLEERKVTFDPAAATPGAYATDISLINWPQNDYWLGNIHEVSQDQAARHLQRARQSSLSLLY